MKNQSITLLSLSLLLLLLASCTHNQIHRCEPVRLKVITSLSYDDAGAILYSEENHGNYLKEKLQWKQLAPNDSLSWDEFTQIFIFYGECKLLLQTNVSLHLEQKREQIKNAIVDSNSLLSEKLGAWRVTLNEDSIQEEISIKQPCILLIRREYFNFKTHVKKCEGKVMVSERKVSQNNSKWLLEEVLQLYEPDKHFVNLSHQ